MAVVERSIEGAVQRGVGLVLLRGEVVREPVVRRLPSGDEVGDVLVRIHSEGVGTSSLSLTCPVPALVAGIVPGEVVVARTRPHRRFRRGGAGVESRVDLVCQALVPARDRRAVRSLRRRAERELDALWAPAPRPRPEERAP